MRKPNFSFERKYWNKGIKLVAGLDEVGRGAWAGPVVAASVIFPPDVRLRVKLNDSKKLTSKVREELAEVIKQRALFWSVGQVGNQDIDRGGIKSATEKAMERALNGVDSRPGFILVDFFSVSFWPKNQQLPIKFGDNLSNSIAAASILAKVARDNLMRKLSAEYPHYDFSSNKGYGTKIHQAAIREFGLCPLHRTTFVPEGLFNGN